MLVGWHERGRVGGDGRRDVAAVWMKEAGAQVKDGEAKTWMEHTSVNGNMVADIFG